MTDQEKEGYNKFLTEWMGECWHEGPVGKCSKCGIRCVGDTIHNIPISPTLCRSDYFTWHGFGALWEKAKENEKWEEFIYGDNEIGNINSIDDIVDLVDPEMFPVEWAMFLGFKAY